MGRDAGVAHGGRWSIADARSAREPRGGRGGRDSIRVGTQEEGEGASLREWGEHVCFQLLLTSST